MPYAEGDKKGVAHYKCTYRKRTTKNIKDASMKVDFFRRKYKILIQTALLPADCQIL
jgi:hypothetical protein